MSQDKKQKNTMTRECIFTALLLLMEQKPYEEITITDIAKKAGVSRMSYYRLYKSKDDILVRHFNDAFEGLLEEIKDMGKINRYQFALLIFQAGKREHRLMEGMFHAKLYEMVLQCFIQYCTYLAEYIFELDVAGAETDYWIHETAGRFCLVIFRWMEKGMLESPEEMAEFMENGWFRKNL